MSEMLAILAIVGLAWLGYYARRAGWSLARVTPAAPGVDPAEVYRGHVHGSNGDPFRDVISVRRADYAADMEALDRRMSSLSHDFTALENRVHGSLGALAKQGKRDAKADLLDVVQEQLNTRSRSAIAGGSEQHLQRRIVRKG
jgi:hypothetical protein